MLRIDHVILGVRDLDEAGGRVLERHGLGSISGGKHEAWGTGNRIVPLGSDYIELLGVVDPAVAAGNPFGRSLEAAVSDGDRFVGWCLRTDDLDGVAARLGLPLEDGARTLPDGEVVRWRLAGRNAGTDQAWLPFFISWDVPAERHPGRAEAPHRVRPLGVSWVEVAGDQDRIRDWLGGAPVPVRVVDGLPGVRAVGVGTVDGEIELRPEVGSNIEPA